MKMEKPNKLWQTGTFRETPLWQKIVQLSGLKLWEKRWLLPVAAAVLLAVIVLVVVTMQRSVQVSVEAPVYQYSMEERVDYNADTKLVPGKNEFVFESKNGEHSGEDTPIYYQNENAMILAKDTAWFEPESGREWCIPAFSKVTLLENGGAVCQIGKKEFPLNGGFLHDNGGTYVALDKGFFTAKGVRTAITPFSFCSVMGEYIRVYYYTEQQLSSIEGENGHIMLESVWGYVLDITSGIVTLESGEKCLLIADPNLVTPLVERQS